MPHFPEWFENTRKLNDFFVHKWSRDVFVANCMNEASSAEVRLVKCVRAKHLLHRWGSLTKFLLQMVACADIFSTMWDLRKMQDTSLGADDDDDTRAARHDQLSQIDLVLRSKFWWAYTHMFLHLAGAFDSFGAWSESCSCHPWALFDLQGTSYFRARERFRKELAMSDPCAMNCRRAPEMAVGAGDEFVHDLCQRGTPKIEKLCGSFSLTQEERDTLLVDWQLGMERLAHIARSKLGFWRTLPHMLCGLGHFDEGVARRAARDALHAWERKEPSQHHALSALLLTPNSLLRRQMETFVAGLSLQDKRLSSLALVAARLRFIPIAERSIEGRHRLTRMEVIKAPHAGPAFVSQRSRHRELQRLLETGRMNLETFGLCCEAVRSPVQALRELNLSWHPTILNLLRSPTWADHPLITHVVYRCDLPSQHAKRKAFKEAQRGQPKRARRVEEIGGDVTAMALVEQALCSTALAHFQGMDLPKGQAFSLPNAGHQNALTLAPASADDFFDDGGAIVPFVRGMERPGQPVFFFKVTKASLSDEKTLAKQQHPGLKDDLNSCMAIARHRIVHVDLPQRVAFIQLESMAQCGDSEFNIVGPSFFRNFGHETLRRSLIGWQVSEKVYWTIDGLPDSVPFVAAADIVTAMMSADAHEGGQGSFVWDAEEDGAELKLNTLRALVQARMCDELPSGDATVRRFSLTRAATDRMLLCQQVTRPSRVLAQPGGDDKSKWSKYQLLSHLVSEDWVCEFPRRRKAGEGAAKYILGDPDERKVFHLRLSDFKAGRMPMMYMLALAEASTLHEKGVLEIKHLQPAKYYAELLRSAGEDMVVSEGISIEPPGMNRAETIGPCRVHILGGPGCVTIVSGVHMLVAIRPMIGV